MSLAPESFSSESLYIAGFVQARAPHVALIIPADTQTGTLVHIRIDHDTSPNWTFQIRTQKIQGDMFLSSLLKIHDVADGHITIQLLREAASAVSVPNRDEFGACLPWVFDVVKELQKMQLLTVENIGALEQEFAAFVAGNRAFARRDRFPNVATSVHCS